MKRTLSLSLFAAFALAGTAAFAEDTCTKIIATGHPQYPAIAYKDGDNIAGAAPMLVEAIAKNLKIPLESKYMGTWEEAQTAARDGKADMIFGIYYNDERAKYLDYVQPAFMYDEVVVFVAKDKPFAYKDENDLIGKKGVTNTGDAAFKELLAGNADYLIAGYYSGLAEAAKEGVEDKVEPLSPAILEAEMFVAFSKKSPCRSLVPGFAQGITEMTTNGTFDTMLQDATSAWDAAQQTNK
jgi:polar amino acid transport system substrate-binding protein